MNIERNTYSNTAVAPLGPEGGAVGSLYEIQTEEDYVYFVAHHSKSWTDRKAIVLNGNLFNK